MSFTGLLPRYLGLESVNLPVIESIEVLTIIPFWSPAYRYNSKPYLSAYDSEVSISSIAIDSIWLLIFWVERVLRQLSGESSNILVVKSDKAAAKKLDLTLPFSTGEKSKATTSLSSEICVTSERAPVWSS